jgi:C1A family cysteine protease
MEIRRHAARWIPRVGVCLVVLLLLVAGLAPDGILGAGETLDEVAPRRPVTAVPYPPGTGYLPSPMDLSHLTGQTLPARAMPGALPAAFDWRNSGMVTPVKNQGDCGACYAFAFLGSFESKLLMDGAGSWDLSENHAKECNWKELNNYEYPAGNPWGSCDGGNAKMIADLYSQTGSVLEACNPYVASDVACGTTCPYQQSVLDYRLISGNSVPNTEVLKQYIYDNGPVHVSIYADATQGFTTSYDGSTTLNYNSPADYTNHGVLIVGWSNSLPPVPGGSLPADGWIVKNSWGTGWGNNGYFYMTYGAGNIGYNSGFVYDWQPYDVDGDIWYYDEDGWNTAIGQSGGTNTTAWILAKYIPDSNTQVARVELWTTDATTDVDVYLYDDFGTAPNNLLASKLNSSFGEAGYHSVALDSRVTVSNGDAVYAVVKVTNANYGYPIALDGNGTIQTGVTYRSYSGDPGSWGDTSAFGNATVRVRTSSGSALAPTVTGITPNSGQNTGTVHFTNLAGSNFQPGATVRLTRSGQADINATGVVVVNSSRITGDFDLMNAATGLWNVVVTNPDSQSGTLMSGFMVTQPGGEAYHIYLPLIHRNLGSGPVIPLVNGDFEAGPTGWTEYSTHGWDLIVHENDLPSGVYARSGSWAAWLGGEYDDLSYIQQQVTVPASQPYLRYMHWIASADACGYDFAGVMINNTTVADIYDLCASKNTGGWVPHVVNLVAYAGQAVTLQIRADTDGTLNSNLYVDDVSFQASAYVSSGSPRVADEGQAAPRPGAGTRNAIPVEPQPTRLSDR